MAASQQNAVNEEDSDGAQSDEDIVLDQSLTVNYSGTAPVHPPRDPVGARTELQPPVHTPTIAVPSVDAVAPRSMPPTIVTIAPPTLKSSKGESKGAVPAQQIPPPIPFRDSLHGATTTGHAQSALNPEAIPQHGAVSSVGRNEEEEEDDGIVRPRVDQKLLKLMSLSGKINVDEIAFNDVDVSILSSRPWKDAGADISDWFNYGFNERTWRDYCCAQNQIRQFKGTPSWESTNPVTAITTSSGFTHHQAQPQLVAAPHHRIAPQIANPLPQFPNPQRVAAQTQSLLNPSFVARPTATTTSIINNTVVNKTQPVLQMVRESAENERPPKSLGICYDFQNKGHCNRGSGCRWSHEKKDDQKGQCFEWENKGVCNYGAQCRWKHVPKNGGRGHAPNSKQEDQTTNDELQARLRVILGQSAPDIPGFVQSMKLDDVDRRSKKKRRRKQRASVSRSRSRSRS